MENKRDKQIIFGGESLDFILVGKGFCVLVEGEFD